DLCPGACPRLLLVLHHLYADNVSLRVLLEDLEAAYESLARGSEVQLPPKTTSFRRWGEALIEHVRSGSLDQEIGFWLAQAPPRPLPLPIDFAEGADLEDSRLVQVDLDREVTTAL